MRQQSANVRWKEIEIKMFDVLCIEVEGANSAGKCGWCNINTAGATVNKRVATTTTSSRKL